MEYVYVLQSQKDRMLYVGWTTDLRRRIEKHNSGRVFSTRSRCPFTLLYYEACHDREDAKRREKYLKTAWGKRYLKRRLRKYLLRR
ncbi:MAG: GIY-YIG nuclease family protein [Parcubacteria group bacterium]|nr:GIY-YIG nuclease family protein [Parcubacteria group bacterium]